MVENLSLLRGDGDVRARARVFNPATGQPPPTGTMAQSQLNMSQITNTSDYGLYL